MESLLLPEISGTKSVYAGNIWSACPLLLGRSGPKSAHALKGLSHENSGPVFVAVGMYLGLNVNRHGF